jgi:hypothetical protein
MGGGSVVGDKVGVGEGGVPTGGEGRVVVEVAGVGLEEDLGPGPVMR